MACISCGQCPTIPLVAGSRGDWLAMLSGGQSSAQNQSMFRHQAVFVGRSGMFLNENCMQAIGPDQRSGYGISSWILRAAIFSKLALVCLLPLHATCEVAEAVEGIPNVVLILADDMGYGDVQTLNRDSRIATPTLNRLAREGMTFVDAHSPSAVCTPTRYGLLTGRYCWRSRLTRGVLGGYSPPLLETGRRTVADMLKDAGFRTGAIGKWHLGMALPLKEPKGSQPVRLSRWDGDPGIDFSGRISDSPIHHGFESFFGVSASLDMAPYVYIRNERFTAMPMSQQSAQKFPYFVRSGPRSSDFVLEDVLDRLTEEAVEFVERSMTDDRPFFLYLPLTAPHKPTLPHPRFRGQTTRGEYGDFVFQVDSTVGQVLEAVQRAGVSDRTMVIYTSDNGSYMRRQDDPDRPDHVDDSTIQGFRKDRHRANGAFRGTKADIYEAGHHVPFFVRWPGVVKTGSRCQATICLTDVFATLVDILGRDLPEDAAEDSCSFLPALRGEDFVRPASVIHHSAAGMFAIRQGRWKLIAGNGSGGRAKPAGQPFGMPYQLFDLDSDIEEQHDLASDHPEIVMELSESLRKSRNRGRSR